MTSTTECTNVIHCTYLREEDEDVYLLATDGMQYKVSNSSVDMENLPCTIHGKGENGEPVLFIVSADDDPLCDEMNCREVTARWNDINTRLLLAWYPDLKKKVLNREIPSKRRMWNEMARRFQENGVEVTAQQAENRWKTLERKYRTALKYPKSSKPFAYFSEYQSVVHQFANLKPKKKKLKVGGKRKKSAASEPEFDYNSDASSSDQLPTKVKRGMNGSQFNATAAAGTVTEKKTIVKNVARELSLLRQAFEQRQIQNSAWEQLKEQNRNKRHSEGMAVFKAILDTLMEGD